MNAKHSPFVLFEVTSPGAWGAVAALVALLLAIELADPFRGLATAVFAGVGSLLALALYVVGAVVALIVGLLLLFVLLMTMRGTRD